MSSTGHDERIRRSDTFHNVLAGLTRSADVASGSLDAVLARIAETAAMTLGVSRVNIWLYDSDRSGITCIEHFDAATRTHDRGGRLSAAEYPSYFAALEQLRTIAAIDAEHDPRTAELRDGYLASHGITTMLDAPILRSGQVVGVLCHEHVGPLREWASSERLFAGNLADLIALALETDSRIQAERAQRALETRLHLAQRLESLGLLAGGVAHDFRNLLLTISGNADMLVETLDAGMAHDCAADIQIAAQRAREICEQLLAFAGRQRPELATVDPGRLVDEMARMLRVRVPDGSSLTVVLEDGVAPVRADPAQLRQVVLNLLTNALDAVKERGGQVEAAVRREPGARPVSRPEWDWRHGDTAMVAIEVRDNGPGMDPATVSRIFEPFFSTKAAGSGLGLAATLGIVRNHFGAVDVQSSPGGGTVVRVLLPLSGAA